MLWWRPPVACGKSFLAAGRDPFIVEPVAPRGYGRSLRAGRPRHEMTGASTFKTVKEVQNAKA